MEQVCSLVSSSCSYVIGLVNGPAHGMVLQWKCPVEQLAVQRLGGLVRHGGFAVA